MAAAWVLSSDDVDQSTGIRLRLSDRTWNLYLFVTGNTLQYLGGYAWWIDDGDSSVVLLARK